MKWSARTSFIAAVFAVVVCAPGSVPGAAKADGKTAGAPPRNGRLTDLGCTVDFGSHDLATLTRDEIDLKRIQLEKKIVRIEVELEVLRMELQGAIRTRDFDLTATQKVVGAMSVKDSEIRVAHTTFLHDVAGLLNDAQWAQVVQQALEGGCGPLSHPP